MSDRLVELQKHSDELRAAIDGEDDSAKLVALYRERRQTLEAIEALGGNQPAEPGEVTDLEAARQRRDDARGKSGADDPGGGGRRGQPRRRGGRSSGR